MHWTTISTAEMDPTPQEPTQNARVVRVTEDGIQDEFMDTVAVEEPLEIRVEGRSVAVTMRTPGHDRELAAGFLFSEGIVESSADIFEISVCPASAGGNAVDVVLAHPEQMDWDRLTRHVFTSSSCGVCGKATIESTMIPFPPLDVEDHVRISIPLFLELPNRLRTAQASFRTTGGIHASALFDLEGQLRILREDVGRHNALDKVVGASLLGTPLDLPQSILVLSGRASFELMQKALAARIPIIVAVGAPSSLAIALAQQSGQTLLGFVRDGRANVYAGAFRLRSPHGQSPIGS